LSRIDSGLVKASGKLEKALNNPLTQFGLNLMARSAPSLTPQSTLGNIGMAGQDTFAQRQGMQQNALQRQLIEAQIGRYNNPAVGKSPFGAV
jgi:hypothetical protein